MGGEGCRETLGALIDVILDDALPDRTTTSSAGTTTRTQRTDHDIRLALKSSRTSQLSRWSPREIAKRSSGDSPPEAGEARSLGIRAGMPGFTSLLDQSEAARQ
jgi:hypothetical protein